MIALVLVTSTCVVLLVLTGNAYLRRATRSLDKARRVWGVLEQSVEEVMASDLPSPLKRIALEGAMIAGCGCFVRSLLLGRLFPRTFERQASERRENPSPRDAELAAAFAVLSPKQREKMDKLLGAIILFDSYVNPLQGWVLRHVMTTFSSVPRRPRDVPRPAPAQKAALMRMMVRRERRPRGPIAIAA